MGGDVESGREATGAGRLHLARKMFALAVGLPGVFGLLVGLWAVPTALLTGHLDRHGGGYLLLSGLMFAAVGTGLCGLAAAAWPHRLFRRGPPCPVCTRGHL